ncbi:hypothetical protein GEMRC1_004075 [Eukaryota sp. GEM-RC1]
MDQSDSFNNHLHCVRQSYDERLMQIRCLFHDTISKILKDRFTNTLLKSPDTVSHALDRIMEVANECLCSDQSKTILQLREQLASAQAQLSDKHVLMHSFSPETADSETLRTSLESSKSLLKSAQTQIASLKASLEKNRNTTLSTKLEKARQLLAKNQGLTSHYENEISLLSNKCKVLEQETQSRQQSFENILKKSRTRIHNLEECLFHCKGKATSLASELEDLKRRETTLKSENDNHVREIHRLKRRYPVTTDSEALQGLKSEMEGLKSQFDTNRQGELIESLKESVNNLTSTITNSISVSEHENIVNNAVKEAEERCYKIQKDTLSKIESNHRSQLESLSSDQSTLIQEVSSLQESVIRFQQRGRLLKSNMDNLKRTHILLRSCLSSEVAELDLYCQSVVSSIQDKFEPFLSQNADLSQKNHDLESRLTELSQSLAKKDDVHIAELQELSQKHRTQIQYLNGLMKDSIQRNSDSISIDDVEDLISQSLVLDEHTKSLRKSVESLRD